MTTTAIEVNPMERGTIIHKLMEFNLKEEIGYYESEIESNKADYEYLQIENKITEEMIEVAEHATQQVLNIYDLYRKRDPTTYLVSEGHLHWATGKGIADVYIVAENYAHIIDLKTGNNYHTNNAEDEIYRGYSAGILSLIEQEKREIRVTVINGFEHKTIAEPYTGEQINYWHQEQQRQLDYKALSEKELDSLSLGVEEMTQVVLNIIKNNPEMITAELLDAFDRLTKVKTSLFNKAKEQVLKNGTEYEGYELKERKKEVLDEEKLIDYLIKKEGMSKKIFGAFKPHKKNIQNNFDAETYKWVLDNKIFDSKKGLGYNFSKKKCK